MTLKTALFGGEKKSDLSYLEDDLFAEVRVGHHVEPTFACQCQPDISQSDSPDGRTLVQDVEGLIQSQKIPEEASKESQGCADSSLDRSIGASDASSLLNSGQNNPKNPVRQP